MELFTFLCPDSPKVWNGHDFSPCFENIFFGFGTNIITLFLILLSAVVNQKKVDQSLSGTQWESVLSHKIKWLIVLPGFGILLSVFDFVHLVSVLQGGYFIYHEWLLRGSQLVTWLAILVITTHESCYILTQDWVLCIWWFIKPFLSLPGLRTNCLSSEGWLSTCLKETCSTSIETIFGLTILIMRIRNKTLMPYNRESHLLEDRLIPFEGEENSEFDCNGTFSTL